MMARSWSAQASGTLIPERLPQSAAHEGTIIPLPLVGSPRKILVTLFAPIGDTLLATPALHLLRKRFRHAHITALTYPSSAGILEGNRDVDQVVKMNPKRAGRGWLQTARALYALHEEHYDLVLHFSTLGQVLSTFIGARQQINFPMPRLWWLKRTKDLKFLKSHAVDRYMAVVAPLGIVPPKDAWERTPRLALRQEDRAKARAILRDAGISSDDVVVAIHPGGEGFDGRKQWALDRFVTVGRSVMEHYQAKIILVGGPDDSSLVQAIAARLPGEPVIAAGKLTLKQTAALIEASTLFIGNDSAPLHMAAAVGTAAIGIFGPSNIEQFRPVGRPGFRFLIAHQDLPCSPCFHFVGSDPLWHVNRCQTRACLQAIPAEEVITAACKLLETR
jgi:predicted lipopolysaccharide heptosyltransferase III